VGRLLFIVIVAVALRELFSPLTDKIPFLGKLPGDFRRQRNGRSFSFPLAPSLVLGIVLTLVINLTGENNSRAYCFV